MFWVLKKIEVDVAYMIQLALEGLAMLMSCDK